MHQRIDALLTRVLPGRWRKRALSGLALLALYALVGFVVVPPIIRSQIVHQASTRLHRAVTVAKVRFNPFTLESRLIGFDLRDRDGTPLVAFDTLVVNHQLSSIVHRALVLKEIRLVRPTVTARIAPDGRLAVADLFEADTVVPAVADTAPASLPRLKVYALSISGGTITFIDDSRTPRYTELFEDLGLSLDGFSTLPAESGDHVLTVSFASGAEVRWTGTEVTQPLQLDGRIEISGARLSRLAQVLGDRMPLSVTSGTAGVTFEYRVTQASDGALQAALSNGALDLRDIAMRPPNAVSDWFRLGRIEASGLRAAWPQRTVSVDLVRVSQPWIAAARLRDGTLDWAPYLEALQTPAAAHSDTAPAWTATLSALEVVEGGVHLEDRTVQPVVAFDFDKIAVRLDSLSTDPARRVGIALSAALGRSTSFEAKGGATRTPMAADLTLAMKGMDLSLIQPYLGAAPPITVSAGKASASGSVKYRTGKPQVSFDGVAAIDGLEVQSADGDRLIAWKSTRLRGIHATTGPDLARIRSVEVVDPFLKIAITKSQEVNLAALSALLPQTDTTAAFPYEIVEVLIKNAEIDFEDLSLLLPFRTRIHSATGSITDVASFGGTPGALEFEGLIDDDGRARATGTLYVSDPYAATEIKADFRNVNLPGFSPYSLEFAGYPLVKGRLDLDLDYRIQAKQLTATHHIVASDLELGERVEGGAVPGFAVKLALSLLKDSQGKIKLDAVVEGTVDDPQFRYSAVVWQVLKHALGRIATAPFRFLGNLLGLGGDDLELVEFDPGRTDLIQPEQVKLDSLAAELGRRPALTISVEGRYDSISDAEAIREGKLKALIAARRGGAAAATAKADTSATSLGVILKELYAAQFSGAALDSLRQQFPGDSSASRFFAELRTRLIAAQVVEPGQLEQLGRDRGNAVGAALLAGAGMDSTRVTVTDPAPVKRKKAGSARVPSEMSMDAK